MKFESLGQQRDEQLIGHRGATYLTVLIQQQLGIRTHLGRQGLDTTVLLVIKADAVLRIGHDLVVRLQSVGHVGKGVLLAVEQLVQRSRVVLVTDLQQPEQIDNLMIAPITDVRPRVLGFDYLVV